MCAAPLAADTRVASGADLRRRRLLAPGVPIAVAGRAHGRFGSPAGVGAGALAVGRAPARASRRGCTAPTKRDAACARTHSGAIPRSDIARAAKRCSVLARAKRDAGGRRPDRAAAPGGGPGGRGADGRRTSTRAAARRTTCGDGAGRQVGAGHDRRPDANRGAHVAIPRLPRGATAGRQTTSCAACARGRGAGAQRGIASPGRTRRGRASGRCASGGSDGRSSAGRSCKGRGCKGRGCKGRSREG